MNPRKAAVLSLNSCIKNGRFVNLELDSIIKKYRFEGLDKSFFTALLYGTMERLLTLDFIISKFSSVPVEKIDSVMLCILRCAVYQIVYMDRVPDSAACNEAVDICKTTSHSENQCGFVNGVLRSIVRNKGKLSQMIHDEGGRRAVSLESSIPLWIIDSVASDYGEEAAVSFARYISDIKQTVTLRVNTTRTTVDELISGLGKKATRTVLSPYGVQLQGSYPAADLYGFDEGLFFVQDEASQLAILALDKALPKKDGAVVVDTCACPGGKTFSAAMLLHGHGTVYSFDLHKNRISLIRSGAERLGLTNVTAEARDARNPDEALFGKADAVICDVPCSGLGVIAKKPDIRYKSIEDVENLPSVQLEILKSSAKYLKQGGTLIYSTCTLRKAENEDIVSAFLKENPEYHLQSTDIFPEKDSGTVTLFPHLHHTDGFFVCKIVKD